MPPYTLIIDSVASWISVIPLNALDQTRDVTGKNVTAHNSEIASVFGSIESGLPTPIA